MNTHYLDSSFFHGHSTLVLCLGFVLKQRHHPIICIPCMQILYWFSLKTPAMNIYLRPIYDHICIMLEFVMISLSITYIGTWKHVQIIFLNRGFSLWKELLLPCILTKTLLRRLIWVLLMFNIFHPCYMGLMMLSIGFIYHLFCVRIFSAVKGYIYWAGFWEFYMIKKLS